MIGAAAPGADVEVVDAEAEAVVMEAEEAEYDGVSATPSTPCILTPSRTWLLSSISCPFFSSFPFFLVFLFFFFSGVLLLYLKASNKTSRRRREIHSSTRLTVHETQENSK